MTGIGYKLIEIHSTKLLSGCKSFVSKRLLSDKILPLLEAIVSVVAPTDNITFPRNRYDDNIFSILFSIAVDCQTQTHNLRQKTGRIYVYSKSSLH